MGDGEMASDGREETLLACLHRVSDVPHRVSDEVVAADYEAPAAEARPSRCQPQPIGLLRSGRQTK
eukprot:2775467-Pleurochrysis_carterae.AAC.4